MQFDKRASQSSAQALNCILVKSVPVLSFAWPYKLEANFAAWHYKTVEVLIYLCLQILTEANETQESGGGGGKLAVFVTALLESFRFKDQDNYDIFLVCRKIFNPESFIVLLFTWQISAVIFVGEGLTFSLLHND